MSQHRIMDVIIETPEGQKLIKGKECRIKAKTWRTRFGLDFKETIYCEEMDIHDERK